jgi:hypothetical protein
MNSKEIEELEALSSLSCSLSTINNTIDILNGQVTEMNKRVKTVERNLV